jgi:hypothetical protein
MGDRQQGERRRQEERIGAGQAGKPCLLAQGWEARRQGVCLSLRGRALRLGKEGCRYTQAQRGAAKSGNVTSRAKAEGKAGYWSAEVTQRSDALDLESGVFAEDNPKRIARSLKASAEHSKRRKAGAYQSAMSMLNFYVNRAGRNLSGERRRILEKAKVELRRVFGRD